MNLDILFIIVMLIFISPWIVYVLVKVGTYAALKAKAEFKDKEEANGQER